MLFSSSLSRLASKSYSPISTLDPFRDYQLWPLLCPYPGHYAHPGGTPCSPPSMDLLTRPLLANSAPNTKKHLLSAQNHSGHTSKDPRSIYYQATHSHQPYSKNKGGPQNQGTVYPPSKDKTRCQNLELQLSQTQMPRCQP